MGFTGAGRRSLSVRIYKITTVEKPLTNYTSKVNLVDKTRLTGNCNAVFLITRNAKLAFPNINRA